MSRDLTHDLMPKTDHDGMSRRLAVLAMKRAVGRVVQPALSNAYEHDVKPEIEAKLGRSITQAADFSDALKTTDLYRIWSSLNRSSQHRMWTMLAEQIDADYSRIENEVSKSCAIAALNEPPEFMPPNYIKQADIHCQPGGYLLDRAATDMGAGLLYEMGGNIYALGQNIGGKDSKAQRIINFLNEKYADLKPKRILELGCSAGAQSTYYPEAYPDAEIVAADIAPALLRYAKARADALQMPVNFVLADAGDLPFENGSFDLIVSHNMLHETAAEHQPAIMQECFRVLRTGGVCLHQDVAVQTQHLPPFIQFLSEWQKENNGEPFWLDYANADIPALMKQAGFDASAVEQHYLEQLDGPLKWYVVTAKR